MLLAHQNECRHRREGECHPGGASVLGAVERFASVLADPLLKHQGAARVSIQPTVIGAFVRNMFRNVARQLRHGPHVVRSSAGHL